MLENLADKGIKQQGSPDIETIKIYHGDVLTRYSLLCVKMGQSGSWIFTDAVPDSIESGYRDHDYDPNVKNTPHKFGIALDIQISNLDPRIPSNRKLIIVEQIKWITAAVESGLFTRGGFYPYQNTIHLDIADEDWMRTYKGTPFWVKDIYGVPKKYKGFYILQEAVVFATACANRKD